MNHVEAVRPGTRERLQEMYQSLRMGPAAVLFESRVGLLGLLIVLFWVIVALLAPVIAPYGPNDMVGKAITTPGGDFLMGTDHLGRDILSRLVYGSRPILILAPFSVACALALGITLGLSAGYLGGRVDVILMRLLDAMMAFPTLLLYMIIIAAVGASKINVVIAITLGGSPAIARIVRSLVLDVRSREFVPAARLRGESAVYIMFREILPNCVGPLIVDACLRVGYAAFSIGALGFLGLGLPPPDPDWGRMVADGRQWLMVAPWIVLFPAGAISTLVIGLNMFADGLNETARRI